MSSSRVATFSATATEYADTVGRALRPVAERVAHLAELRPGQDVLDVGTGTGNAALAAVGDGRRVTGIDAAPGMLEIARAEVPGATFVEGDFAALPFADGSYDVLLAVNAINFAADPAAVLAEWLRVTRPGGRLSLSIPGPRERLPVALYAAVWERHGIRIGEEMPLDVVLAAAADAGWEVDGTDADPDVAVALADVDAFHRWRSTGSRGRATRDWSADRLEALDRDMLAVTPRDAGGAFRIPFGAQYLTARRPSA